MFNARIHAKVSFLMKWLVFGYYCLQLYVLLFSNWVLGDSLPIATNFTFPSPLPRWPPGGGFATGEIDLGGLQVRKVSTFQRVWEASEGGPDNLGASFFEPSSIPEGFSMLASYAQPNNQKLFGWVLVGKTNARDQSGDILTLPTDYNLVVSVPTFIWQPIPPDGYKALSYVVTTSPSKPPLDKIRCVRSDFTDEAELSTWIWENVYSLRPKTRGANAKSVSAGTFGIQTTAIGTINTCLKSKDNSNSSMPNLGQIGALFQTYSPIIYFHPDESFFPSSVNWYFSNGALLYKKGEEGNPAAIKPNGTNLPQGGDSDGSYWIDLPVDEGAKGKVRGGEVQSVETYLHAKSVLGGTFTDLQMWLFYPFNGPATAKVLFIKRIKLGKLGEHVGDWEHVTLRISNFDGILDRVFFGQHNKGQWVDSSLIEFSKDNKFVGYSSWNGHATYYTPGVVLLSGKDIGIRDDTWKGNVVLDTGARFSVVAGDGLSAAEAVVEPPWLNYNRQWGPRKETDLGEALGDLEKLIPGILRNNFEKAMRKLPRELYSQEGPTGPKSKNNWSGDED